MAVRGWRLAKTHERLERVETRTEQSLPPELLDVIAALNAKVLELQAELMRQKSDSDTRWSSLTTALDKEARRRGHG